MSVLLKCQYLAVRLIENLSHGPRTFERADECFKEERTIWQERGFEKSDFEYLRKGLAWECSTVRRISREKESTTNSQEKWHAEFGGGNQPKSYEQEVSLNGVHFKASGSGSIEPYSHPDEYERDKWIYENIDCHSFEELSQKLNILARQKNWNVITSRNGFKKRADAFSTFHNLPGKRFRPRQNR